MSENVLLNKKAKASAGNADTTKKFDAYRYFQDG